MGTERICPGCGRELAADAARGLCPECLMKAGFGTGVAPQPGEPSSPAPFSPPPVAELARLFPELEIVELIGRGGMGAVYRARQPALDRWVALKILPPQATERAGFAERFTREARALARLNHPNIVAVHEFGQAGGMPYFVMEFVEGVTLRRLVQERRLGPREALQIVPQICEALQFAHDEGVVHRDIKPENILMDKKGRVKIADFGIAKIVGGDQVRQNLTRDQVLGTPHYMAPEQIEHPQAVDHRADIYSLGVVFYEMLTGELPLGKFAPPSRKVQVDVRLDEVVLRALEKEPERRYQQANQVKTDVETIAATPVSSQATAEPPKARGKQPRARTCSAGVLFLLPAIAFAWFLLFGHQQLGVHLAADILFWFGTLGFPASVAVGTLAAAGLLLGWQHKDEAPAGSRWSWLAICALAFLVLSLPLGGAAGAIAVLLGNENNWDLSGGGAGFAHGQGVAALVGNRNNWNPSTGEAVFTFACFIGLGLTAAATTLLGAAAISRMARAGQRLRGRWGALAAAWFWPCLGAAVLVSGAVDRLLARSPAVVQTQQVQTALTTAASRARAQVNLQQARDALTGGQKDMVLAKKLLLEIAAQGDTSLDPSELCHVYVYLGYIEDRAGHREQAIPWYQRALQVQGASVWIRQCAEVGLKEPLIWIRHLDESTNPDPSSPPVKTFERGQGYVTTEEPPTGLVPAKTLSPEERQENFEFLGEAIDKTYAGFDLKAINWPEVCRGYRARLDQAATAEDFYLLLFGLVNELKDTHSWLQNYKPPLPASGPGLTLGLFDGKLFAVAVNAGSEAAAAGVKPGAELLEVDGLTVQEEMERLRPRLPGRSSERAWRHHAARYLLAGDKGSTVTVKLRPPDGQQSQSYILKRSVGLGSPPARTCPFPLTRQRFVHFGRHPSGLGYIWIESFNGREEIAGEFDRALEALRTVPGLILDIRDNPGGFGTAQPHIVGRFITNDTLVAISYTKNGPGHQDLQQHDETFPPSGEWQYTSPVALLVNEVTGSAADLFACYMRSAGRVVTVGSTTHGNLSGVAAYAVLPCGLVVRISNGYVCDAKNRPIEGNGNEPDVSVSPTIADVLQGRDPVLEKAAALLADKTGTTKTSQKHSPTAADTAESNN